MYDEAKVKNKFVAWKICIIILIFMGFMSFNINKENECLCNGFIKYNLSFFYYPAQRQKMAYSWHITRYSY
jgi:accessory gene regulator protein AgrB